MTRRHSSRARAGVLAASLLATPAAAQQVAIADGVGLTLAGRIHVQFATTSVDSVEGAREPASAFILRRARLTFDVTVNDRRGPPRTTRPTWSASSRDR